MTGAEWVLPGDFRGVLARRGFLRRNVRALTARAFRMMADLPERPSADLMRLAFRLRQVVTAEALCLLLAWQQRAREYAARLAASAPAAVPESVPAARWSRLWVLCEPSNGPNVADFGTRRARYSTT